MMVSTWDNDPKNYDPGSRAPPGQFLVEKFSILSYGSTIRFDPATWEYRLSGLVEKPVRLNYQQFCVLPKTQLTADFHCVTTCSRLNNVWEGVSAQHVVNLVRPNPEVRYVLIHCDGGYTTNRSLADFLDDDVIFAQRHDGQDIDPDHG